MSINEMTFVDLGNINGHTVVATFTSPVSTSVVEKIRAQLKDELSEAAHIIIAGPELSIGIGDNDLRDEIKDILDSAFFEVYQSSGLVTSDVAIEEIAGKILVAIEKKTNKRG